MVKTENHTMKGQASLEQLMVTAVGLTFVGIIFFFAMTSASDTVRIAQARDAVEKIARSADLVYVLGPGSKTSIDVLMPDGVTSTSISGRMVLITVSTSSGKNDIFSSPRQNVSGSLTSRSGRQTVTLTVNSSGAVVINSTG